MTLLQTEKGSALDLVRELEGELRDLRALCGCGIAHAEGTPHAWERFPSAYAEGERPTSLQAPGGRRYCHRWQNEGRCALLAAGQCNLEHRCAWLTGPSQKAHLVKNLQCNSPYCWAAKHGEFSRAFPQGYQ